MKETITIAIWVVFVIIVFCRKILPVIKRHKKPADTEITAVETPSQSPASAGSTYCEAFAVDVCSSFGSLSDLSETISLQFTKKLDYINARGILLSLDYFVVGSILIVLFRWQMQEGQTHG